MQGVSSLAVAFPQVPLKSGGGNELAVKVVRRQHERRTHSRDLDSEGLQLPLHRARTIWRAASRSSVVLTGYSDCHQSPSGPRIQRALSFPDGAVHCVSRSAAFSVVRTSIAGVSIRQGATGRHSSTPRSAQISASSQPLHREGRLPRVECQRCHRVRSGRKAGQAAAPANSAPTESGRSAPRARGAFVMAVQRRR